MKLVIDIPERWYETLVNTWDGIHTQISELIVQGTPLPKGHGRLIDADALMKEFTEFVKDSNNSDFADVPTWNDAVSLVEYSPTIIEADKEGDNDENR